MELDFTFDKEKVRKECKKLVRISNLGEKTLQGYMNGKGFNPKDYSITELAFLEEIAKKLQPSTYSMVDVFEADRLLSFYKNEIISLFENRTINYIMSDEEWWCAEQFDSFEAIRNERLYLRDFYEFVTKTMDDIAYTLTFLPFSIHEDYLFCQGMPYNFKNYFFYHALVDYDSNSAHDLLCNCITKWVTDSLPTVFTAENEEGNSKRILYRIISSPSYMKEFIKYSCFSLTYEQMNNYRNPNLLDKIQKKNEEIYN